MVCCVWDAHFAAGAGTPLGAWRGERRDVQADFLRLFADEAKAVPPIVRVAVAADADNTNDHSVAHLADVAFAR